MKQIPALTAFLAVLALLLHPAVAEDPAAEDEGSFIQAANLVYANNKTSECFADQFLAQIKKDTHINTKPRFSPVRLDSAEMYEHPFAVMTGSGSFVLTAAQRDNMRRYLERGGFIVASASCSDKKWVASLRGEIGTIFPDNPMVKLEADHPIFHSVYDITTSKYKKRGMEQLPHLEGLEIDGRVVLIFSPDGLNDTENAGPNCCCCGGNEVKEAKRLNVNILAYALTH